MKKLLLSLFIFAIAFALTTNRVLADFCVVSSSASISQNDKECVNNSNKQEYMLAINHYRTIKLKAYLESHNSPLADHSKFLVLSAHNYQLDWKLVPAIAGVESTFGKRIPSNSYNAYGWANGKYYFESWDHSIGKVSQTLREDYLNKGLTSVEKIGQRYAPPSKTWAWKVKYFMDDIDNFDLNQKQVAYQ